MAYVAAELDATDWRILDALQRDARLSLTALGRRVGLSRPAVAERVRRLEEDGVITGYCAVVNPARVGRPITAFVRLHTGAKDELAQLLALVADHPDIVECYRGTGESCVTVKIVTGTLGQLDALLDTLAVYGVSATSVMLATVFAHRPLTPPTPGG